MNMPLTMQGRVCDCIQLNYRTPGETIRTLLPDGLEPVVRGPWAFWNVMCCRVEKLRPAGLPALCGLTYHHVAYRLRVQAMNDRAEVVQGLYFTRSEVDAKAVSIVGNKLTDLRMHPAAIAMEASDCGVHCKIEGNSQGSGMELVTAHAPARLQPGSCFPSVEDARQFCRYTACALAVTDRDGRRHLRTTRVSRSAHAWNETPLAVHQARMGHFESIGQAEHVRLEWACRLSAMDYTWRVGETAALLKQPAYVNERNRQATPGGQLQHAPAS